jgi:hypothetical protein
VEKMATPVKMMRMCVSSLKRPFQAMDLQEMTVKELYGQALEFYSDVISA